MKPTHGVETTLLQFRITTTIALDRCILDDARAALAQAAARPTARPWYAANPERIVKVAAAFALAAAVLLVALVFCNHVADDSKTTVKQPKPAPRPKESTGTPSDANALIQERAEVDALFAARDVEGLIETLKQGRAATQLLAAHYLGEIGDERAIPALSVLAAQWQEAPFENPFRNAIDQIKRRAEGLEPNAVRDAEPSQAQAVSAAQASPVLTGRITDVDTGQPLENVQMRIFRVGGGTCETTTDSNGVYAFGAVNGDGVYVMRLSAPEHVTPAEWADPPITIQLHRDEGTVKDFALARGAKIMATVLDDAAQPVSKARVCAALVSDEMGREPKHPASSDANGVAWSGALPLDAYMVTVTHPDYAPAGQVVTLTESGRTEPLVFVLEKGSDIVGMATCSDGLPPAGWQIGATPTWWHSTYTSPLHAPIAEDGSFVLPHIVPGAYRIQALVPLAGGFRFPAGGMMGGRTSAVPSGGGHRAIRIADVNLPPEKGLLDLEIAEPSWYGRVSISGHVTFTGGEYGRGFWIHAQHESGHEASIHLDRGETDFTLTDLVPGRYTLEVFAAGGPYLFRDIAAPSDDVVLEIDTTQGTLLQAYVVDKQTQYPISRFQYRLAGRYDWHDVEDSDGTLELVTRGAGPVCVTVRAEGHASKTVELSPEVDETYVIELGSPAVLSGVVTDEAGQPIEAVTINYGQSSERGALMETGPNGRFSLKDVSAADNEMWLVFRHPDYARNLRSIAVAEEGTTEVAVILGQGGAVEGYVYDEHGVPLPEEAIYFLDEKSFSHWERNRGHLGTVTTDETGFYRIEHMPEELCYAFRDDPENQLGVVAGAILPRADRTVRFDLGGPWRTSGRLLLDGEPLADTPLLVTYGVGVAQGFEAYAQSDAQGHFSFWGLPVGRRTLYWAATNDRRLDRWVRLDTFDFQEGLDLDLGDLCATSAAVAVTLVAEDPTLSLASWEVVIQEYHEDCFSGRSVGQLQRRNDVSDTFVFSCLAAGQYEALAHREGYPSVRAVFAIDPGQDRRDVRLTIPVGSASLSGQIYSGASGWPRTLMLRSLDQRLTAQLRAASDGTFMVNHLPAGQYAIGPVANLMSRRSTLATVALGEAEHQDILVRSDPTDAQERDKGSLHVMVTTEGGPPLATPDVWLERQGHIIEPIGDTDDRKGFWGSPGTYTLHVHYPGYRSVCRVVEMQPMEGRTTREVLEPLIITMQSE